MPKGFEERNFIKKAFSKIVDKKVVDEILNGNVKFEKPEEKECGYILIEIIQDEFFEEILSNLIDYSKDKNLTFDLYGTIIQFFIGDILWNENKGINFKNTIEEFIINIPEDIRKRIRGIYGSETAKIGMFGSNYRSAYIFLLKNYFKKLLEIDKLNIGEIKEL